MWIGDGGHFPWSPFFSSRFVRFLRLVSCSQTFCGTIYILTPQRTTSSSLTTMVSECDDPESLLNYLILCKLYK